jgi:hypothetical protein
VQWAVYLAEILDLTHRMAESRLVRGGEKLLWATVTLQGLDGDKEGIASWL